MTDLLCAITGFVMAGATGVGLASLLGIRGRATFAAAALVLVAAHLILIIETLSLVDGVTRTGLLLAQLTTAGATAAAWAGRGRPPLPSFRLPESPEVRKWTQGNPVPATAVGIATFAAFFQLVVGLTSHPNNGDSMMYHLSRAAHWLQQHSATQIHDGSIWQNGYPPNGEMLQMWTMGLLDADRLAFLIQWFSLPGLALCAYAGARLCGLGSGPSAFGAAVLVTLPVPVIEATTTQTELVTAFLVAATAIFGARGLRDRDVGDLVVGGVAYGLALGTKGTAALAAPCLLLLLGAVCWRFRPPRAIYATALACAVGGFAIFGLFNYVLNLRNTSKLNGGAPDHLKRAEPVLKNELRVFWGMVETPGVDISWLEKTQEDVGRGVFGQGLENPFFSYRGDTNVDDTSIAFGPLGWLLIMPLFALCIVAPRAPPWTRILGMAGLGFVLIYGAVVGYTPFTTRQLLVGLVFGGPMLGYLHARRPLLSVLALFVAAVTLVPLLLTNPYKRILDENAGDQPFWHESRLEQEMRGRPQLTDIYRQVLRVVGPRPVGFVGPPGAWDYPLFGPHFERKVVRFGDRPVTDKLMQQRGVAGVLITEAQAPPKGVRSYYLGEEPPLGPGQERKYYLAVPRSD